MHARSQTVASCCPFAVDFAAAAQTAARFATPDSTLDALRRSVMVCKFIDPRLTSAIALVLPSSATAAAAAAPPTTVLSHLRRKSRGHAGLVKPRLGTAAMSLRAVDAHYRPVDILCSGVVQGGGIDLHFVGADFLPELFLALGLRCKLCLELFHLRVELLACSGSRCLFVVMVRYLLVCVGDHLVHLSIEFCVSLRRLGDDQHLVLAVRSVSTQDSGATYSSFAI